MTKREYIDFVNHRLGLIDKSSRHPKQFVEACLDSAWNQILHDAFKTDYTNFDMYGKWYNGVSITNGVATLPSPIVQLIDKSEGVREIKDTNGYDYYPISEDDFFYARNQQSTSAWRDGISFTVKYDRVEFMEIGASKTLPSSVDMLLVIPFREYDLDEDIPAPSGGQYNLINMAVQFASGQPPTDLTDKNNG